MTPAPNVDGRGRCRLPKRPKCAIFRQGMSIMLIMFLTFSAFPAGREFLGGAAGRRNMGYDSTGGGESGVKKECHWGTVITFAIGSGLGAVDGGR